MRQAIPIKCTNCWSLENLQPFSQRIQWINYNWEYLSRQLLIQNNSFSSRFVFLLALQEISHSLFLTARPIILHSTVAETATEFQ